MNQAVLTKNRKCISILAATLLAMCIVTLLFWMYRKENQQVRIRSRSEFQIGDENDIEYEIEEEDFSSEEDCRIHGWFVQKGRTYDYFNAGMMEAGSGVYDNNHLCYVKDDLVYELPTKLAYRGDVNDILSDGTDYAYSGFYARIAGLRLEELENAQMGMIVKMPDGEEILYLLK